MAKTNYSPTFPMFPGDAAAVTPSDSVNLDDISVIYCGSGGTIKVTTAQGSDVTFANLAAGSILPLQVRRVWSTGTTATGLIRIF